VCSCAKNPAPMTTIPSHLGHYWRRHPSHALWIVGVLVVASAVTTAVWSVAQGLWLQPLPFADPERLVTALWTTQNSAQPQTNVSGYEANDIRVAAADVMAVANIEITHSTFTVVQESMTPLSMAFVTTNLFDVLGVGVASGRPFVEDDAEAAGVVPRAVVTDRLWHQLFPGAAWVPGRTIEVREALNRHNVEIVGVLPPVVTTPGLSTWDTSSIDMFTAMPQRERPGGTMSRRVYSHRILARLHPGVSREFAEERMTAILRQIDTDHPLVRRVRTAILLSLQQHWLGRSKGLLGLLAAAAFLVILVALSNLAGLLAIIRTRRTQEYAIRGALGATAGHLRTSWFGEVVPLAVPAGLMGGLLAMLLVGTFQALAPADIPRLKDLHVGAQGWLVAVATATVVVLLACLAGVPHPLRRAWSPLQGHGTASGSRSRRMLTHGIVATQTAVVLTLLAGAALIATTLWRMLDQPLGFSTHNLAIVQVRPTEPHFRDAARYQQVMNDMRRAALALPGQRRVALTFDPPLGDMLMRSRVTFRNGDAEFVHNKYVSDGFMEVVGATMLAGRDFVKSDFSGSPVALVNEQFATKYFGSASAALGQSVQFGPPHEIVGVVSDVREGSLTGALTPILYPLLDTRLRPVGMFHLVSREARATSGTLRALGQALRGVDPSANVEASWLTDRLRTQTAVARTQMYVLGTLASVTLALALLGIHSTIRQVVDDRGRELAIRAALGATPERLVTLTLRGTAVSVVAGIALGGMLSVFVARVTGQFLFDTSPFDPFVWAGASVALLVAALVAAGLPARAAGRANPILALRAGD
jgi:predicted permease